LKLLLLHELLLKPREQLLGLPVRKKDVRLRRSRGWHYRQHRYAQ
jgi:hypothetical protein